MSDFISALVDLLPEHNSLKNSQNQLRKVLDTSVGEWFDQHSVQSFYDDLFIETSTGSFLDLFGRDYGVIRQSGESDTAYRERIIQEKNDKLTPSYLLSLYGLTLYVYVASFDVGDNDLTSDNPYIQGRKMSVADATLQAILDKKFILDNSIVWVVL